ncbi:hypothetical protein MsAg5_14400 [Methanosarcinaceae archaeon Ag5]|uniref:Uncharacterized protein n=1 Tax=Methanolapillus africanus TaxID=3028297 RepID=A0AAE4MJ52_9EURY|nr:hypothetical protein [Methanosarcinaceae archaeon Ag5]
MLPVPYSQSVSNNTVAFLFSIFNLFPQIQLLACSVFSICFQQYSCFLVPYSQSVSNNTVAHLFRILNLFPQIQLLSCSVFSICFHKYSCSLVPYFQSVSTNTHNSLLQKESRSRTVFIFAAAKIKTRQRFRISQKMILTLFYKSYKQCRRR